MYELVIFWAVIISIGVIVWLVLNYDEKQKTEKETQRQNKKKQNKTKGIL